MHIMASSRILTRFTLLNILLKKRLLGAAILLLLLALLLPAFLTGSGDVLSLQPDRSMPNSPTGLQEKLEEQIAVSRQLQSQVDEKLISSIDSDGEVVVSREIPVPELDSEATADQQLAVAQPSINTESQQADSQTPEGDTKAQEQKPKAKPEAKLKVRAKDIDLIGQLEKSKRKKWAVQVGAFESSHNADKLVQKLKKNSKDYEVFIQKRQVKGKDWQVVFLGPILSRGEAEKRQKTISKEFKVNAVVKAYGDLGLPK